jgi:hypothetical protein
MLIGPALFHLKSPTSFPSATSGELKTMCAHSTNCGQPWLRAEHVICCIWLRDVDSELMFALQVTYKANPEPGARQARRVSQI